MCGALGGEFSVSLFILIALGVHERIGVDDAPRGALSTEHYMEYVGQSFRKH